MLPGERRKSQYATGGDHQTARAVSPDLGGKQAGSKEDRGDRELGSSCLQPPSSSTWNLLGGKQAPPVADAKGTNNMVLYSNKPSNSLGGPIKARGHPASNVLRPTLSQESMDEVRTGADGWEREGWV